MSRAVVAIIPARGGSKGLPRKNLREFGGKPLIAHSIEVAHRCPAIARTIVSTEDEEIAEVALTWGAEVMARPRRLAGDHVRTHDVVKHVLSVLDRESARFSALVLLQPTSPLRRCADIARCCELLATTDAKSVISVTPVEHHPYKDLVIEREHLAPLFDADSLDVPRQALPSVYRQNGSIYAVGTDAFSSADSFFVTPCRPYVMPAERSIDIDSELDLEIAEVLLSSLARCGA